MHLTDALELASHRYPESEALACGGRRFTYQAWNRLVNGAALELAEAGVAPGDAVALCSHNRAAAATAYFAVLKAGAWAVWLSTRWKAAELAYGMRAARVRAVLHDAETRAAARAAAARCREKMAVMACETLAAAPRDHAPGGPRREEDPANVLYTSGTTRRPKGVVRSHASDYHAALAMIIEHRWQRGERILGAMPLYHTMGLHTLISSVLLNGTCILQPRFDAGAALDLIAAEGITALYLVPTAWHDLLQHAEARGGAPPRVEKLAVAGAPMPPGLAARCQAAFRPQIFVNHYGCTEMHVITVNPDAARRPDSAGRPALHTRMRIVRTARDRRVGPAETVPRGTPGEVIVDAGSPQAFRGYLHRPRATARALREGWYFTGDLGVVDASGDLRLLGRVDDLIISGGENVSPEEVEAVLREHPRVRDAAVAGLPHPRWGQEVTAFVVPADRDLEARSLESFCRHHPGLARYKRPRRFVFVAAIPRSPAGKVLRARLRQIGTGPYTNRGREHVGWSGAAGTTGGTTSPPKGRKTSMASTRLAHFELPPQWSTMREAARLEGRGGQQMIHMEKGDFGSPEFQPPPQAIQAAMEALSAGHLRYSPGPGLTELREALAREMTRRGRPTQPGEIVVTPGAKFAIAASLLLFLDDGDEVIMPDPGYPPDEFWARYLRAAIRHVGFADPRNLDVEHLERLLSPRTKLLILNTPQRPSGQLVENTDDIAALLRRHPQVIVISDEIFSKIVYPPHRHRSLAEDPELRERTVVIDTFSKSFAMTGFRIGWVTAPAPLARNYDILLQNSCTNVSTMIQEAALAALHAPADYLHNLVAALARKRDLALDILGGAHRLTVDSAQGTFYLYPRLPAGWDDRRMVRRLLEHGVAVVPGSAFGPGGAGRLRLTFALDDATLAAGVRRLVEVVDSTPW